MTRFLYQMDDKKFHLPWTQADMHRVRLWYIDLLNEIGDIGRFEFWLFGGS